MEPELKTILESIRSTATAYQPRIEKMEKSLSDQQRQMDAIEIRNTERIGCYSNEDPICKAIEDSPELARIREVGRGKATILVKDLASLKLKTAITTETLGTAGVLMPQLVGGVVPLAQRRLFLRDLLSRGQKITAPSAYFIQEEAFTNNASPQAGDGALKGESADTFTTVTRPVATIAHWIPISRQALDDAPALAAFVKGKMLFGLRFKEELEFLAGDGTGNNLTGLLTSATAFNTGLLSNTAGWTKVDLLRRALQQVERADEVPAGFFMLHPDDWADIELTKSSQGEYLISSPRQAGIPNLWGRPVVVSTAITSGVFLCGSSESAEVLDRLEATIEISLDYSDYRTRNLALMLCECRTVLCIYRPGAFVYGSLTNSPA